MYKQKHQQQPPFQTNKKAVVQKKIKCKINKFKNLKTDKQTHEQKRNATKKSKYAHKHKQTNQV